MIRRRSRRSTVRRRLKRIGLGLAALPMLYLVAALFGSLFPVNSAWQEPVDGITIYLADNGIHADIVMPVRAEGLDWTAIINPDDTGTRFKTSPKWVAFGAGEEQVYLDTPTWWDITPKTIWSALTGSKRVLHVEWVDEPRAYASHAIRLRPEEYRRLWAAVRSDFELKKNGDAIVIAHPGYGCCDSFYRAGGRFSALHTCNSWVARKFYLAGIKTSLWPPFVQGLVWRYRKVDQST